MRGALNIYKGAVGHYAWLTPTQMIDGRRWERPNPGPLINGGRLCGLRRSLRAGRCSARTMLFAPVR